jgi:alpha-galactosidase/6-phospho-beta-glucosidase family protein
VIKVAMIGAGSVVFSKNLTSRSPNSAMRRSAYMDVDADRLEVGANLCQRSRNRSAHIQ